MTGRTRPDNEGWEVTSVANLVTHLAREGRFPRTVALNKPIVRSWIYALDTGMSGKALKLKAKLVLEAFRERDGVTEADADAYQAANPPQDARPVLTHQWVRYRIRPGSANRAAAAALPAPLPAVAPPTVPPPAPLPAPQRAAPRAAAPQPVVVPVPSSSSSSLKRRSSPERPDQPKKRKVGRRSSI